MATYVCHAVRTAHALRSTNNAINSSHLRLPRSPSTMPDGQRTHFTQTNNAINSGHLCLPLVPSTTPDGQRTHFARTKNYIVKLAFCQARSDNLLPLNNVVGSCIRTSNGILCYNTFEYVPILAIK
jgi:hypothetical protein